MVKTLNQKKNSKKKFNNCNLPNYLIQEMKGQMKTEKNLKWPQIPDYLIKIVQLLLKKDKIF